MSLLKYLKQKNGLPDPKGSLSDTVPSRARANSEVEAELVRDILLGTSDSYSRSQFLHCHRVPVLFVRWLPLTL